MYHIQRIGDVSQEFAKAGSDFVRCLSRSRKIYNQWKENNTTTDMPPIQKAPLTLTGLNTRDSSNPAEKANSSRSVPPVIFSSVREKPTQISPSGPQMAKAVNPHAASSTHTERILVGSLRRKNAYRMFPIYSKNKDQLGPLSGYISPSPRISEPGVAGIRQALSNVATSSAPMDTSVQQLPAIRRGCRNVVWCL